MLIQLRNDVSGRAQSARTEKRRLFRRLQTVSRKKVPPAGKPHQAPRRCPAHNSQPIAARVPAPPIEAPAPGNMALSPQHSALSTQPDARRRLILGNVA